MLSSSRRWGERGKRQSWMRESRQSGRSARTRKRANKGEGPMRREDLRGTWAMQREAEWPSTRRDELAREGLAHGLESADSIRDRSIPLFDRSGRGYSSGCRFMAAPFLEDMRALGGQDVAIVGVPLDCGTTFRSGTRWGPMPSGVCRCLGPAITPLWASILWRRSTWW